MTGFRYHLFSATLIAASISLQAGATESDRVEHQSPGFLT